jgi:hypothetical protein
MRHLDKQEYVRREKKASFSRWWRNALGIRIQPPPQNHRVRIALPYHFLRAALNRVGNIWLRSQFRKLPHLGDVLRP